MELTTEQGNRIIAEFMQLPSKKREWDERLAFLWCDNYWRIVENLKYHSSWDWLMPVVEKMHEIGYSFTTDPWSIELIEYLSGEENVIINHQIDNDETKIYAVWYAVITFLQYYNSLPSIDTNLIKKNKEG